MNSDHSPKHVPKPIFITGWVITVVSALPFFPSVLFKFINPGDMEKTGYNPDIAYDLALVELACVVAYLFPRTGVLGAIMLTGYLGGAIATHVRVGDGMYFIPATIGIMVWLGLYLRDTRVRSLVPWRSLCACEPETPKP